MTSDQREIQAFYDAHPYPPPVEQLDDYRQLWEDKNRRRADYHLNWPTTPYRENQTILVPTNDRTHLIRSRRWRAM